MTGWRSAMRHAAEQDEQDHLSTDEAEAMRRVVLAQVADEVHGSVGSPWVRRPLLVTATLVAIISVGVATGLRLDRADRTALPSSIERVNQSAATDASRAANLKQPQRQLQFMTPGGTRIIWVFNSDLDLKASLR